MIPEIEKLPLTVHGQTLEFANISLSDVVNQLHEKRNQWHVVITPNIHHIYLMRQNPEIIDLYKRANILLADGWPIATLLSRQTGKKIRRVTGADLLEHVLESQVDGRPLVLVGGENHEVLQVLGQRAASSGWAVHLEGASPEEVADQDTRKALLDRIARSGSGGIVALGLGAPKQELLAEDLRTMPGAGGIICIGMALNFSAGYAKRAPLIVRRLRLEWAHRILQEPRRLMPRYVKNMYAFIPVAVSNLRKKR